MPSCDHPSRHGNTNCLSLTFLALSLAVLVGSTVIIGYDNYLATLTH